MVVTGDITQIDLPRDQKSGPDRRRRHPRRGRGRRVRPLRRRGRRPPQARPADRGRLRPTTPSGRAASCGRPTIAAARPEPVLDVEVIGGRPAGRARSGGLRARRVLRRRSTTATSRSSSSTPERIAELNREHRGKDGPTDVLSFPVDEATPGRGAARARRRRDLPRAHGGPRRGGRPRRAAPHRAWTTRPTRARCSRCRPRSLGWVR